MCRLDKQRGCDEPIVKYVEVEPGRQVVGSGLDVLKEQRSSARDLQLAQTTATSNALEATIRSLGRLAQLLIPAGALQLVKFPED